MRVGPQRTDPSDRAGARGADPRGTPFIGTTGHGACPVSALAFAAGFAYDLGVRGIVAEAPV